MCARSIDRRCVWAFIRKRALSLSHTHTHALALFRSPLSPSDAGGARLPVPPGHRATTKARSRAASLRRARENSPFPVLDFLGTIRRSTATRSPIGCPARASKSPRQTLFVSALWNEALSCPGAPAQRTPATNTASKKIKIKLTTRYQNQKPK